MSNGKAHIIGGALAGLAVACVDREEAPEVSLNPIVAMPVGAIFGKLPDLLEPATNPNHRQFCHSVVVLAAVGYGFKQAYEWRPDDAIGKLLRGLALAAAGGYISHLLLDSITPKSLPLLGRI